jgi:hypothetical protein
VVVRERQLLGVSVDTKPEVQDLLKNAIGQEKYETMLKAYPMRAMIVTVLEHRGDGFAAPCYSTVVDLGRFRCEVDWTRPMALDWQELMDAPFP